MEKTQTIIGLSMFVCSCMMTGGMSAQPPVGKGYKLLYEEDFKGNSLDTTMWRYRVDVRKSGTYMNGVDLAKNVSIHDGMLQIECRQEMVNGKMENTGGGIISKKDFGYGYYECLSKPFMEGRGVHTAFWQRDSYAPNNCVFEIDSYEIDSKTYVATNNLYMVLGDKQRKYVPWPHRAQVPFTLDKDGWFLDAYEYTPEGIIFYDNGKVVAKADWNELNAHQAMWLTALNGVGHIDADKEPGSSYFRYFRYYAKDYPGVNILSNGNFEFNQDKVNAHLPIAWTTSGDKDAITLMKGDAHRDAYRLHLAAPESGKSFHSGLQQTLSFIMDGDYVLSAWVRTSPRLAQATLTAANTKSAGVAKLALTNGAAWHYVSVPVKVVNHEVLITLDAEGNAGEWLDIDDINLMKPLAKGTKQHKPRPFRLYQDYAWGLAEHEPIHFSGDEKFYFFDRSVGIGDTISVCFRVNADEKANMTPISRMPMKGNSGWSVQLTSTGGVVFRIGSVESHTDVLADNVYTPGKEVALSCVFEQGTAHIYADGKLRKTVSGITQDTKDATAAGRLGTVGQNFAAVGEVVMKVASKDKETTTAKNFRGSLSKVHIYNKFALR
jgi:hypothetical protein